MDLRNNPGGVVLNTKRLLRYLMPEEFSMIHQTSLTQKAMWQGAIPPFLRLGFLFGIDHRANGRLYINSYSKKYSLKHKLHYDGKLSILVNGGSYSAAALTTALLKSSKRGKVVGQETGGSYHLAFAGFRKAFKLKHSKIKILIPLLQFNYAVEEHLNDTSKGIVPDIEVLPTLEDYFNGRDTQLHYLLKQ